MSYNKEFKVSEITKQPVTAARPITERLYPHNVGQHTPTLQFGYGVSLKTVPLQGILHVLDECVILGKGTVWRGITDI